MSDVIVVGSANLDLVLRVAEIPAPGQTVAATAREQHVGGKGLNQAVAAARAGAATTFVGAVGHDDAGTALLDALTAAGVVCTGVTRVPGPSGTAMVVVSAAGENTIVLDAGANGAAERLTERQQELVRGSTLLLCQLEVPLPLVVHAAQVARGAGRTVVLNAAPARPLPAELLALVDVLIVNETEAAALSGRLEPEAAARELAATVADVVVTLGAAGALHVGPARTTRVPGLPADVVDTTGAGDACTGVLAAHLAGGGSVVAGLVRGMAAGSLAVATRGAVPSLPTREQVDALLGETASGETTLDHRPGHEAGVVVRRCASPDELLQRCSDLLRRDPVSTNVVATAAGAEAGHGQVRSEYLVVERADEVVAVAMRTPGMPVALSSCTDEEAEAVADALLQAGQDVAGASGPAPAAWAFVRRWTARTHREVARAMAQGVYVCHAVVPTTGVRGRARLASPTEVDLLAGWFGDFAATTGLAPASAASQVMTVGTMIAEARLHLWLDAEDRPVSMAVVRTPAAGLARLGPVWTPVADRRHGFATALTAEVTAQVVARGHGVMLFTDLDNPTSTHIYQAVGYRRVGDAAMLLLA